MSQQDQSTVSLNYRRQVKRPLINLTRKLIIKTFFTHIKILNALSRISTALYIKVLILFNVCCRQMSRILTIS